MSAITGRSAVITANEPINITGSYAPVITVTGSITRRTTSMTQPQFRTASVRDQCSCDACESKRAAADASYAPPDSYAPSLAALRAAEATPESRFEEQHKAARLSAVNAESASLSKHFGENPGPRLTAAELAPYAAPDPYKHALDAMKEAR